VSRLAGIEALRGIAAFSVLGLHVPAIYPGLTRPFDRGYLGVDLFFLLSGLVLAQALERRPTSLRELPGWIAQRYWRMWPVMAIGALIGAPLLWRMAQGFERFAPVFLSNFLLIPVGNHIETFPLNVPAWTISFILFGNFLHVALFRHLDRRGLVAALIGSLVWLIATAMGHGSLDVGAHSDNMLAAIPRLLFSYLLGMLLWQLWGSNPPKFLPSLPALAAAPLLFLLAWFSGLDGWWFDLGFVVLAMPLIMAGVMHLHAWEQVAGLLGKLSFPLYAVHFPLLIWARNWGWPWWAGVALALVGGYLAMIAETRIFSTGSRR
jgi:peptidoglycan/LPS O-acetylase OafA/YrhL